MRSLILLLVALPLLVLTCSDKKPSGPIVTDDLIPPARITTIWICDSAPTWADLCWYAVGDDSLTGKAHTYDIRLSQSPIAESNFSSCQAVEQSLEPRAPKIGERLRITDLDSGVVYFVAIKTSDDAGNWSAMSVVAHINKTDTVGPFAIEDLSGEVTQDTSIVLRWTAPADQNSTGALWKYDIRYFGEPIRDDNWESALPLAMTVPHSPNSAESLLVDWPTTDTILYFAVRSEDLFRNYSDLSNMIQLRLPGIDTVIVPPDTTDSVYVAWETEAGELSGLVPVDMIQTSDGCIAIVSYYQETTSSPTEIVVAKVDSSGGHIWESRFSGGKKEMPAAILESANNTLIVAGTTWSFADATGDPYLLWIDQSGGLIQDGPIEMTGAQLIRDADQAADGQIYLVGQHYNYALFLRLSPQGDVIWDTLLSAGNWCVVEGPTPIAIATGVVANPDGSLIANISEYYAIGGHSYCGPPFPADLSLCSWGRDGTRLNYATYATDYGDGFAWSSKVIRLANGTFVASGYSASVPFPGQFVSVLSSTLGTLWSRAPEDFHFDDFNRPGPVALGMVYGSRIVLLGSKTSDIGVEVLEPNGSLVLSAQFGTVNFHDSPYTAIPVSDRSFVVAWRNGGSSKFILTKMTMVH